MSSELRTSYMQYLTPKGWRNGIDFSIPCCLYWRSRNMRMPILRETSHKLIISATLSIMSPRCYLHSMGEFYTRNRANRIGRAQTSFIMLPIKLIGRIGSMDILGVQRPDSVCLHQDWGSNPMLKTNTEVHKKGQPTNE